MKYKLEIQIRAGEKRCGGCRMEHDYLYGFCVAFDKHRKRYHDNFLRLPECLKAAKLMKEIKP